MRVEAVFVGTELLEGKLNTHSVELARRLAPLGLALARCSTVGDGEDEIARAVRESLREADAVLVCGGLGPTFDDLSREGVAKALGRPLEFRPELFKELKAKFARRRLPMPPENRRQAFLVKGGRGIRNRFGSAPGQVVPAGDGKSIFLLPGPGSEMIPMFESDVAPRLAKAAGAGPKARLEFHFGGIMESQVDHKLRPLLKEYPRASFTILAGRGLVDFYATAPRAADLRGLSGRIRSRLGYRLIAEGPATLSSAVGERLARRRQTLAAAESCTGGMFSETVTATPGSSRYFLGGVVSYSNKVKESELGVPEPVLKKRGAVSAESAEAMAEGARRRFHSDWAVAITGIAGPDGGTKAKPVGTVFIALAGPNVTDSRLYSLNGDRNEIRLRAVNAALFWLWRSLA